MRLNTASSLHNSYIIHIIAGLIMIFSVACKKDIHKITNTETNSTSKISRTARQSPNILIILADDVGYEIPTCDGGQSYVTSNIDTMAMNGMRFTQCHAAPLCSPSRFMLLTGKYNFRNYTTWGGMSIDNRTIGNMFQDAGYVTCYTGKWQLDGGDNSIRTFGWEKYSVWLPFKLGDEKLEGSRYKSSKIYQDGGYMPQEYSQDKYSDDLFTAYLLNFIDSVKNTGQPFLAFYSMILPHEQFCPTPDDVEYTIWDYENLTIGDTRFFPSMIKYSDKKIGEILTHLNNAGLLQNTLILYFGDNGTHPYIFSQYNGFTVEGGKSFTNEPGTNVPLIAYAPGNIAAGAVSDVLIDFTDFLPTLADVARISKPADYGTLDGVSFAPALAGAKDSIRAWVYDSYAKYPDHKQPFVRWVQNDQYKLYDTVQGTAQAGQFVRIEKVTPDSSPIPDSLLTSTEKKIKRQMLKVLRRYN
ncbi:MAG: sulfatase-like hydrolase/transferase [Parafilimonas sp.]